ncbi:MAG: amidohydrolase family protein, partial [Oligosphaeraceae bacterium]|nr:amidohydrolase family protein [Oligosphaeraceae bacterium]
HLLFTDQAVETHGSNAKMAPPLREESDRLALIEALCDGSISVLATDHAPHSQAEKAQGMLKAPFGIIGIEQAVALCLTLLYHTGKISLSEFIRRFSCAPREILQLPQLKLEIGETAELTILDLDLQHRINLEESFSKSRNCPYDGMSCRGRPWAIFSRGKLIKAQSLKNG